MIRVSAYLMLPVAMALVACGPGGPNAVEMMGTSPSAAAALLSVSPPPNASGVAATVTIEMRFSHGMDVGTEGLVDLHQGDIAGPMVPMSCAWSTDRSVLSCLPAHALMPHTAYLIHVGAGMMDADHHPLDLGPAEAMGGQWVMPSMMGGLHAGSPWGMMGGGWQGGNGSYGMAFRFATA